MFPRSAPLLRRCTTLLRVALIADLVDEILTNKCPRCGQVFLDFSGCFALSCASCPCKFCAWCFEDCGDALGASGNRPTGCHMHVSQCPHKPADTGAYFAPTALFDAQNQARRKRTLRVFIRDAVEPPLRDAVLMSVVSDLNDPGVGLGPFLQELVGAYAGGGGGGGGGGARAEEQARARAAAEERRAAAQRAANERAAAAEAQRAGEAQARARVAAEERRAAVAWAVAAKKKKQEAADAAAAAGREAAQSAPQRQMDLVLQLTTEHSGLMVVGRERGLRAVNMGLYALHSAPGVAPRVYRRVEAPHKFLFRDALHHWRIASDREDYAAVRLPVGVLRSEGRGPYITDVINGRSRWMFRNAIGKGFTLDPNIIVQCSRAWATANNERRLPPHKHTGRYVRRARRVLPLSAPPRGYLRHATTVSPRRPPAARALAVRA